MSQTHVITGATGFVGGAIALELLRRTDDRLLCLVRPGPEGAQHRLERSLSAAALAYGQDHLAGEVERRCRAVEGDILQPLCGVTVRRRATTFWHAAASLRFEDRYATTIRAHNVDGTAHALALAQMLRVESFNHVSTAYVAGASSGLIRERLAPPGALVNNRYEASKVEAERLVARAPLPSRILRPSIVIGHSRTLAATAFTGFYGAIRGLIALGGLEPGRRPLTLRMAPETPLNLVPVDRVARDAVAVGLAGATARVYHLTNECQPSVGAALRVLLREVGARTPRFVDSLDRLDPTEQVLDQRLRFFVPYWLSPKTFCRRNTDGVAGSGVDNWPLGESELARHVRWYLGRLSSLVDVPA